MARAFLLVGTNQGDLQLNIKSAIENIQHQGIAIVKRSSISRTKPWGCEDQPDFLNMTLKIETSYEPQELLYVLKSIETRMGRRPDALRWGPRIIDIDILFYEDRVIESKELTIPHPEFLNRPFAIRLLAEIEPSFEHPCTHKKVCQYLESRV
jgi:2-amino-4-hydroxy-6-hydroxymethyldihydropteridine diphosphokinase